MKITKYSMLICILSISVLAILLFTSCTTETTPAPKPVAPVTPSGPQKGGIAKIGFTSDALVLGWPAGQRTQNDFIMSRPAVETLFRLDANGKVIPWLATSFKTDVNAKTIILTLQKGVKFHDGTDFNAAAVKWNIETYSKSGRDELKTVTSVDIIDDYTVRLNLASWDNTIISTLAIQGGPMVSPAAWEKAGTTDKERQDWYTTHPIGTGPFQFVSWQRDVKVVYKKFDGYWQKGKPNLDGIEMVIIKDPTVALTSFQAKEFDVFPLVNALNAKTLAEKGITINKVGLGALLASLYPDSIHPASPFANLKVRQAVAYAIDNKAITTSLSYGYYIPTNQWGTTTNWDYNPNVKGYPYNPDKAKQLLAEAGYPNGLQTKIIVSQTSDYVDINTAIQGYLAKAGINVQLDVMDMGKYNVYTTQTGWENCLLFGGNRSDHDVANQMRRVVASYGSLYAKGLMHPEKIDTLLAQANSAPDYDAKKQHSWALQAAIYDEYCILIPIYVVPAMSAKYPNIKSDGFMTSEANQWTPEDTWIEKK